MSHEPLRPVIFRSRISLVWLFLTLFTAVSWSFGLGGVTQDVGYAGVAIIVIAFVKVRFVAFDFMELRLAHPAMRWAVDIWCIAVGSALCVLLLWRP